MNNAMKILIVGGTGTLGRETVQILQNAGHTIRVMTRTPEKAAQLLSPSVEVVKGDLIDAESLKKACENIDVVIASAHSLLGKGKYTSEKVDLVGHKALIDAAKNAEVRQFVYLSVIGANAHSEVDFWKTKYDIEQYLKQSGMNYIIIRASAFMEMHLHELIGKPILEKGKVTIFGNGNNPTNFISVKDIAQLIGYVIQNPVGGNQIIEIGGLDNMTKNEAAKLYGTIANREVKISHLSPGFLKIMSKIVKPIHPGIARVMRLSAVFDETDQTFDPSTTLKQYPIQLTSVSDFIKKQVKSV